MKHWTLACLLGVALLTACSHSDDLEERRTVRAARPPAWVRWRYGGRRHGRLPVELAVPAMAHLPASQEDLTQTAGDRIFFDTDRNSLNPQATATLDRQSSWLQRYPQVNVWVAGNCDERGTEEYNLALGQRRAAADRDYLVAHGVQRSRIETISYGKSRPIDSFLHAGGMGAEPQRNHFGTLILLISGDN